MTLVRSAALALTMAFLVALSGAALAQGDELQEANRLFKQGQLDRAMDRVDAFLASRPKDARGRFMKGLILTEQNKAAEAIKVFTSLTEDFPELPEPYNNLAVLYASQGQYDRARTALEMAIRTHPSYATAHENLGDIYAKMASQAYDKALQLDRGNAAAQTKLNLIKDLFTGGPRAGRPVTTAKAEPPVKIASAPAKAEPPAKTAPPVPVTKIEPEKAAAQLPAPPAKTPAAAPAPAQVAKAPAPRSVTSPAPTPPAAKPQPAAAAPQPEDAVLKAIDGWAKAWASNDVPGYLAHYAPNFETPKGMSRADWEAQRKARIAKPRQIEVEVQSPKVKFDDQNRATVTFRQRYRSDTFKADARKTLVLVKTGDRWLIQQEDVGG